MATRLFKVSVPLFFCALIIASLGHAALAFRNVTEGQPVPGFTLKDLAGNDISLSSFAGKVVVVTFFKPDQEFSVRALKDLVKMQAKLGSKVVILAIMPEMNQQEKLKELVEKEKVTFPVLLDEGRKTYGAWGAFLYPTTGIVDKEGRLAVQVPSHNWKFEETVEGNVRLALGEINKEQLAGELNPKQNEEISPARQKAENHIALARKLMERKMTDKAAAELAQAVEADPTMAEAKVEYGFLLLMQGDAVRAQENFSKAAEQNPRLEDAKTGLGASYVAQGQVDKGIEVLNDALKLNPKPARTHFELGKAYEKKGAPDKAAEHYRKALEELAVGW
ncbi:MAG: tetratricopeptide repeat protein [Nitrospirota bacterium]